MNNPMISIIIPVYNTGNLLKRCIRSVLKQSFSSFEIIIVDDGSTETTSKLCDEMLLLDNRIKVFHKNNGGQLHTRTFGISKSTGYYVMFLDSDDSLCKNALYKISKYISQYNCDLLVFGFRRILNNKIIWTSDSCVNSPRIITDKRELLLKVLMSSSYNSLWRKVVKRTVIRRLNYDGYYHLRIAEDLLQSMDFYNNCSKALFVDDILYNYYINDTSVTHSIDYKKIKDSFEVREYILSYLNNSQIFLEHDYNRYISVCIETLINQIRSIATSTLTTYHKLRCYKTMRKEKYVSFLYQKSQRNILLFLFWKEQYTLLIASCKFLDEVKKIIKCFLHD